MSTSQGNLGILEDRSLDVIQVSHINIIKMKIKLRVWLVFLMIVTVLMIAPISCAQLQPNHQAPIHKIKQFNIADSIVVSAYQENSFPHVVNKANDVVAKQKEAHTTQGKPQLQKQTKTDVHVQDKQVRFGAPGTKNVSQENIVQEIVPKSDELIAKKTKTDLNTNKKIPPNSSIKFISNTISGKSDLPNILLSIVVAFLTILVSVAIAIFSEKKEFEALDRNVILDHIIKAKWLIFILSLTFFPLLFWNGLLTSFRLAEIFLWIICIVFINKILISSYHWMKGNKFSLRFGYLKNLRNIQDMEEAWRSVWQTENINHQNEQEFFDIFHSTIDRTIQNNENNLSVGSKLLDDFYNFFNKRSIGFFTWSDKTLVSVLQWHFEMWDKKQEHLNQDNNINKYSMYGQISSTMDSIFQQIAEISLKERHNYSFFKRFKNHAEKHSQTLVSSRYYNGDLFRIFYKVFFKNILEAPERFDIWEHYFPKEWKITKVNLQDPDNIISRITLKISMDWASRRIWEKNEENDFQLDDVSRNLFPDVDPILWAPILLFVFSPYGDDRCRAVIERPWNFGFFGRPKSFDPSEKKEVKEEYRHDESNTFDLSFFLFKDQFSKDNLVSYIHALERLSYPEESKEERKRLRLHGLFDKMLKFPDPPE